MENTVFESKPHYTYQVQLLIDAYNNGLLPEVESITIEPRYGYLAKITYLNGSNRIIYGHDTGFNAGSSEALAKDKGYSKFILRSMGIKTPQGEEFLLPWWADTLRGSDRQSQNSLIQDTSSAHMYIESQLGYPVFTKPVSGSQGMGVKKVHNESELQSTFDEFEEERVKVAIVEEALAMPDYRLLLFDGELVNAYERQPLSVMGNGLATIEELIHEKNEQFKQIERDVHLETQIPDIIHFLAKNGLSLSDIVPPNTTVRLSDVSNLSAGGTPRDISEEISEHWAELGARIARGFNLRICGVDLACKDIGTASEDYSVIEVNATPGARHFMATSPDNKQKLEDMFVSFFRTPE